MVLFMCGRPNTSLVAHVFTFARKCKIIQLMVSVDLENYRCFKNQSCLIRISTVPSEVDHAFGSALCTREVIS